MSNKSGEKGINWWMRHVIGVLIVAFIGLGGLIACNNTPAPVLPTGVAVAQVSQTPGSTPACEPPTAKIRSNVLSEGVAGQQVALGAEATGMNLSYSWKVSAGNLADSSSAAVIYTLPPINGKVVITLRVDSLCGSAEDDLSLMIVPTNTPTLTPTPTRTATPTATSTKIPTARPTLTPTLRPKPILLQPVGSDCVGTTPNMVFEWKYYRGLNSTPDAGGEYFAINLWTANTPRQSIAWVKEPRYEVNLGGPVPVWTHFVDCKTPNGCSWNVDVIVANGPPGSGMDKGFKVIASSRQAGFCIRSGPTLTPTPDHDGSGDGNGNNGGCLGCGD